MYKDTYHKPHTIRAQITVVKILSAVAAIFVVLILPIQGINYLQDQQSEPSVLGESTSVASEPVDTNSSGSAITADSELIIVIIGAVLMSLGFLVLLYAIWDYRKE